MNINQFIVSVTTDRKINIYDKRNNNLIYGSDDQKLQVKFIIIN